MDKKAELHELAMLRKATRWEGYKCIGDYHSGDYECDCVSPYTKSAGNVNADVMVMLQDWSSDERLKGSLDLNAKTLGLTPSLPTNINLRKFLTQFFHVGLEQTYCTNLFPFIKTGGISARIPKKDLIDAAHKFALPQIEIVNPKLVICLGLVTFNALRIACNLTPIVRLGSAIENPFSFGGIRIWCQAHTGSRGQSNRKTVNVLEDWRRMKDDYLKTAAQRADLC